MPKELAQVIKTGEIFKADLTPAKSFLCNKMSSFVRDHREDLNRAIEMLVCKLAMSVNVKFNIEPEQAPDIAMSIYKKYYFCSIEEVALILRKISDGELVKIYDRLSKDMIMEGFRIYDEKERSSFVDNKRSELDREYREGRDEVIELLGGEKNIGRMIDELSKEEEENKTKEENYKAWREKYFKERNI